MSRRAVIAIFVVGVLLLSGVVLSGCGKEEENEKEQESNESDVETVEEEESEEDEEEETDVTVEGFDDFSDELQTVGSSAGKEDAEYSIVSIEDSEEDGYHRFEFVLGSEEDDELPLIEASLNSAGGYISIRLDRVTSDGSGIAYQTSRDINKDGVLRLYHQVTPVATEEVYQVGISSNTIFYLHPGTDLRVILDVKYPGDEDGEEDGEDSMEFTDGEVELSGTNTQGDARFTGYSWSTNPTALAFVWSTSAVSGNPTPPTSVSYDSDDQTVTVTFTELEADSVTGADGEFEAELTTVVDRVVGSRTGTTSTYVFYLNRESEYRIFRSTSPNQVTLEVKR